MTGFCETPKPLSNNYMTRLHKKNADFVDLVREEKPAFQDIGTYGEARLN